MWHLPVNLDSVPKMVGIDICISASLPIATLQNMTGKKDNDSCDKVASICLFDNMENTLGATLSKTFK
jgi:hypothetical protein